MSDDRDHFQKLERMYLSAPINKIFEPEITINKGAAEISIRIKHDYHHAAHAMHGAVYFKMLDDASFFAANSVVADTFVLTTHFTLHFLKPISSGRIISKGKLHFASKSILIADAVLYNEQGEEIAFGTGNFIRSRMPLSPEIGYQ